MKIEKVKNLVTNLHNKTEYAHNKLKQALNYGSVLKRLHKIIKFKLKAWLKSYIEMKQN